MSTEGFKNEAANNTPTDMSPHTMESHRLEQPQKTDVHQNLRPFGGAALALAMMMTPAIKAYASEQEPTPPTVEDTIEAVLPLEATATKPSSSPMRAGNILRIFVSPKGSDHDNSGLSASSPVQSVDQVQQLIKGHDIHNRDVEVLFDADQGSYHHQGEFKWNTAADKDHTITFKSADKGKRPKFVGTGSQANFMQITHKGGGDMGLRFDGLVVKNYRGSAFSLKGGIKNVPTPDGHTLHLPNADRVEGVKFSNMLIENIGNKPNHVRHKKGYGAFVLRNAEAEVNDSIARNLENRGDQASKVHLMYAVVYSKGILKDSVGKNISGDPLKARDRSRIIAEGNKFMNTGIEAIYLDSYQRKVECASLGSVLKENVADKNYRGTADIPFISLRHGNNKDPIESPYCPPTNGQKRVYPKNNTYMEQERD